MTVYVDDMRAPYGRMKMCHMIADTLDELHAMADKIGVNRKWHQAPDYSAEYGASHRHYDIALSKRALALKYGAVLINRRQLGVMLIYHRKTGQLGSLERTNQILRVKSLRARLDRKRYVQKNRHAATP